MGNIEKFVKNAIQVQNKPENIIPSTFVSTIEEKAFISAYNGQKLFTYKNAGDGSREALPAIGEDNIRMILLELSTKASMFCGYKVHLDVKTMDNLVTFVFADLALNYPNITKEELIAAYTEGQRGVYGEFIGLSPKTVIEWVKAYFANEQRKQAIKRFETLKNEMKPKDMNQSEIEKVFIDAYEADKQRIKNGEKVFPNEKMFLWCERNGHIKMSNADKKELTIEVRELLEEQKEREFNQSMRQNIQSILDNKELFQSECRAKAYMNHLKSLV